MVFTSAAIEKSGQSLPIFLLSCAVMLVLGIVASWLFSKVEDRYSDEREAIDAGGA